MLFILYLLVQTVHSWECGSTFNREPSISIQRPSRRLLTRDSTLSPIRLSYYYQNFELGSSAEEAYFQDSVMDAVDSFFKSVLKVYPLSSPLVVSEASCGDEISVPSEHQTVGLTNTDIVVYITSVDEPAESYVAYAGACLIQSSDLNNVLAGRVVINEAYLSSFSFELQVMTLIHEITHLLGFSSGLYPFYHKTDGSLYGQNELYIIDTIRGTQKYLIKSPTVLSYVRSIFGCSTLEGYELESQGGTGTAGSHWDMRVAYNDFMISRVTLDAVYSTVTFALLKDSGWYDIDWSYLQTPIYGEGKGCTFHTEKCLIDGVAQFPEFCTHTENRCDLLRLYKGQCNLVSYTNNLPTEYQYFSDPKLGGEELYIDYCPIVSQNTDGSCRGTGSVSTTLGNGTGESICTNCRCLEGTLSESDGNTFHTGCYEVASCESDKAVIRVRKDTSTFVDVDCPFTGGNISVSGYQGYLTCPSSDILCANVPCKNACYGRGKCVDGQCQCDEGRSGDDCSSGCHSSCATCSGSNSNQCTSCPDIENIELKSDGTCNCIEGYTLVNDECSSGCHSSCATCSGPNSNQCTSCPNIENIELKSDGTCNCIEGYTLVNDECSSGCHSSCATCSGPSSNQCTSCPDIENIELKSDGTCNCIEGYTLVNDECSTGCSSNCLQCQSSDPEKCTSCYEDMVLIDDICYCVEGATLSANGQGCELTTSSSTVIAATFLAISIHLL